MSSVPEIFCPLRFHESGQRHSSHLTADALDLKILSPLFYSHVVRHSHITAFITSTLLTLPAKSQTFCVSDPQALLRLLDTLRLPSVPKPPNTSLSALDYLRWRFLQRLRNLSPQTHATSVPTNDNGRKAQDIRSMPMAIMDEFAQQSQDSVMASKYRRSVMKLFVSDMIAFGEPVLLDVLDWFIQIVLCFFFVECCGTSLSQAVGSGNALRSDVPVSFAFLSKTLLGCYGMHLWRAFKAVI